APSRRNGGQFNRHPQRLQRLQLISPEQQPHKLHPDQVRYPLLDPKRNSLQIVRSPATQPDFFIGNASEPRRIRVLLAIQSARLSAGSQKVYVRLSQPQRNPVRPQAQPLHREEEPEVWVLKRDVRPGNKERRVPKPKEKHHAQIEPSRIRRDRQDIAIVGSPPHLSPLKTSHAGRKRCLCSVLFRQPPPSTEKADQDNGHHPNPDEERSSSHRNKRRILLHPFRHDARSQPDTASRVPRTRLLPCLSARTDLAKGSADRCTSTPARRAEGTAP